MKDRINRWWIRIQSRLWRGERGVTTLDWIGLTAVILTLLSIIIVYFQTSGGRQLGITVANAFNCQIARWEGHGGRCGSGGGSGGSPPGGWHSPGGGSKGGFPGGSGPGAPGGGGGGGGGGAADGDSGWKFTSGASVEKGPYKVKYVRTTTYVRDADGNWVRDETAQGNGEWTKKEEKTKYGVTFLEAKKTFAEGAALEGKLGDDNLYVSGELGSYTAEGGAKIGWDNKSGFAASVNGEAGVYAAKASAEATGDHQFAPGYSVGGTAKGEAWLGAEASGKAALEFGKNGVRAGVGGEAFVGGKAEATGQVRGELAGVEAAVTGKAGVSYGLGVKAKFDGGLKDGKLSFKTELGATVGLGVHAGVDITVDVGAAARKVVDVGKKAVDVGKKAWNELFSSLPPPVCAQSSPFIRGPT